MSYTRKRAMATILKLPDPLIKESSKNPDANDNGAVQRKTIMICVLRVPALSEHVPLNIHYFVCIWKLLSPLRTYLKLISDKIDHLQSSYSAYTNYFASRAQIYVWNNLRYVLKVGAKSSKGGESVFFFLLLLNGFVRGIATDNWQLPHQPWS